MKTPEEIKKGLECCHNEVACECEDCPYSMEGGETLNCDFLLGEDALAYIRQIEAERDAAVKAIELHKSCIDCKHSTIIPDGDGLWIDCPKRDGRCRGLDMWQWRGVQKEEN